MAKAKPLTTETAARARAAELAAEYGLQADAAALARLGGALMAQAAAERQAKGGPAYKAPAWVRAARMTREQAHHAMRHGPPGWRDAEVEAAEAAAEARKAAEAAEAQRKAAEAAEALRRERDERAAKHAQLARALAEQDFDAWVELAMQPDVGAGGLWLAVARLTGDERDRALRSAFSKAIEAAKPKPPAPTAAPTAPTAALVAAQRAGLARRRAEVAA